MLRLGFIAMTVGVVLLGEISPASADVTGHPVTNWVSRNMVPLDGVDPGEPLDDLAPLRKSIGGAQIVGLGESVHGVAEELRLKHRVLRVLVEQLGFRSIAWEEQWTTGVAVNEYISGGAVSLVAVMSQLSIQWQNREVADVLRWLREFNAGRADKVRYVGVEYYFTGLLAYNAVQSYVAGSAPDRLTELCDNLGPITPKGDISAWVKGITDKQPFIDHAQRVYDLVAGLPHRPGDQAHAVAVQHARQIMWFYVHYSLSDADALVYRDARAAKNLRWWQEFSGDKVAYWAALPHTANAPDMRHTPDMRFPSVGSYLRRWYGQLYLSIGFTFDHGTISFGSGQTLTQPPPAPDWFEQPLASVRVDQFAVDLRQPAPPPVWRWLHALIKTRGQPSVGLDSITTGGSVAQWFDLIIHRQRVTPAGTGWQSMG